VRVRCHVASDGGRKVQHAREGAEAVPHLLPVAVRQVPLVRKFTAGDVKLGDITRQPPLVHPAPALVLAIDTEEALQRECG
jgi:hypothetical protein